MPSAKPARRALLRGVRLPPSECPPVPSATSVIIPPRAASLACGARRASPQPGSARRSAGPGTPFTPGFHRGVQRQNPPVLPRYRARCQPTHRLCSRRAAPPRRRAPPRSPPCIPRVSPPRSSPRVPRTPVSVRPASSAPRAENPTAGRARTAPPTTSTARPPVPFVLGITIARTAEFPARAVPPDSRHRHCGITSTASRARDTLLAVRSRIIITIIARLTAPLRTCGGLMTRTRSREERTVTVLSLKPLESLPPQRL
jgi:hypothetical protein